MTDERIDAIQTRWSIVRNAHLAGKPESEVKARQLLVLRYSSAIRRYLGGIVRNDEEANDLSQEIMLRLMRGDFAGADPGRGRFRDLLKTALRNMVRSAWQKSGRRRTVAAELDLLGNAEDAETEAQWTSQWRKTLLDNTWNRMLAEDGGQPGPAYHVLKLRTEFPDADSDELAERLSRKTGTVVRPDNCRQVLKRARARFIAHLLDEVRAGLDSESDERLQEDLAALGLLELMRDSLPDSKG